MTGVVIGLVMQATVGLFDASVMDANAVAPMRQIALAPTCGQPKAAETVQPTEAPSELRWDDVNAAQDCVVLAPFAGMASREPNGYRAALKLPGTLFGAPSSRFLAPAAQPILPPLQAGVSFNVGMDHDGLRTVGYRLYVDGAQVGSDLPLSSLSGGLVSVTVPGLTAGSHALEVAAFNASGEVKSAPIVVVVPVALPSAGTTLRRIP